MIKYSFIIPVKEINNYIRSTVLEILKIKRNDYEVIVYPDKATDEKWDKTRQIATNHLGPASKRNLAIKDALGEILIFIDDDAYPIENFLDILDKDIKEEKIIAVGGPAVTPINDSFWQRVSGAVFLSSLSGGNPERYTPKGEKRFIDDWPSVNLSVKKNVFEKIGGFNCQYWPGEDTKLCLDLLTLGKILYDPELIVYHHRRSGLLKHLKQIGGYGLHRGFFAKKYPATSLKFRYFVPSLFDLFIFLGLVLTILWHSFLWLYLAGWILYLAALIKSFFDIHRYEKNVTICLNAMYYILFTHLYYGLRFIQGFIFTKQLKSKLRK